MNQLKRIEVKGFKSIRSAEIELRPLNVLVGANGAGKSNLISLFKMLGYMSTSALQEFIGRSGGADSLLHYGSRQTPVMSCEFQFATKTGTSTYTQRLAYAAVDTLIFVDERVGFQKPQYPSPQDKALGAGHKESGLPEHAKAGDKTAQVILKLLRGCRVFQFHDTSETAHVRKTAYIEDNRYLRSDAGNLAPFLYSLRETRPEHYSRIIATIQQIAPFFADFDLAPSRVNPKNILLNWRDKDSKFLFGPHQLSDGTLRAMALITLLLQPEEYLPDVLFVDEPELGLHPVAIHLFAALLRSVSAHHQVVVSTQSVSLVDRLEPEDVIVVERQEDESAFRRLNSVDLDEWLQDYTLSELWEKNVIGGRP
jgi:predicted ATPase